MSRMLEAVGRRTPRRPRPPRRLVGGSVAVAVGSALLAAACTPTTTIPAETTQGAWSVLPYPTPVRAIHATVLRTGNVLLVEGSGNDKTTSTTFKATVWNPTTGAFTPVTVPMDLFCAGHTVLPDGRVLIMGGNSAYSSATTPFKGLKTTYVFDPETATFQREADMAGGRWYPSATERGSGDVLTVGGLDENGAGNTKTEQFSATMNTWDPAGPPQTNTYWGMYPSMILTATGQLFYSGSHVFGPGRPGTGASLYNVDTGGIQDVPGLRLPGVRDQSTSVLLPPAQNQKVMIMGGGNVTTNTNATNYTDIVDLKSTNPTYVPGPNLGAGKMVASAVILPDGNVFETGGSRNNRANPVHEASMYNPRTNTMATVPADPKDRMYHSESFLLPDGRVASMGNNPADGTFDTAISIYRPWYYGMTRPVIGSTATEWKYGTSQPIAGSGISSAMLIRPASVTHSSDPNQRSVDLPVSGSGTSAVASITSNANLAPPGWYMLFVRNASNVPSIAKWIHLS